MIYTNHDTRILSWLLPSLRSSIKYNNRTVHSYTSLFLSNRDDNNINPKHSFKKSYPRRFYRSVDLSLPHLWYDQARQIKRNIICHMGPTNSGKTYNALQCLKQSENEEW